MNVEINSLLDNDTPAANFNVQLTDPMLYDRLHTLSMEYSLSTESLVNAAVRRLVNDVDFVRGLRAGKTEGA